MSIGKVYVVLALTLAVASCKAPSKAWLMSTLAGSGEAGFANGAGSSARFKIPAGVALDSRNGKVYVADKDNHRILKVSADGTVTVSTLAGTAAWTYSGGGFKDGPGSQALFDYPRGVAVDSSGNVYVADKDNHRIRKVTKNGMVSTLAGSGATTWSDGGFADGPGSQAWFSYPIGIAVDSSGNIYVADYGNHRIRKVNAGGMVSTLAGSGAWGFLDGPGSEAQFNGPIGVAVDSSGNVYVADVGNNCIRKVTAGGVVSTLAGTVIRGFRDGTGRLAQFNGPSGVAVDSSGNVYVADTDNHRIRKIVTAEDGTVTVSTLAGSWGAGSRGGGLVNGAGSSAQFDEPTGVAVDSSGNVYVADRSNSRIRKIVTAEDGTVTVSTLAGIGRWGFANGAGKEAQFSRPFGVAVDSSGNLYVADTGNHRIRKIE